MQYSAGALLAILLTIALAACLGDEGDPEAPRTATVIDWSDFIRLRGVSYVRTIAELEDDDLGSPFGTVQFRVSGNVSNPSYRAKDGDAAFLEVGTPVYTVRGYVPTFRLAARRDGRLRLYEADANPAATRGVDLLDIGGSVTQIGINSAVDGTTRLAAIDDPEEVAALVQLVLDAPVDHDTLSAGGTRYFVAFQLDDGTEVVRAYWPGSGELHRGGIMLPPEFAAMVEHALTAAPGADQRSTTSD
jgi:hypothetical protein